MGDCISYNPEKAFQLQQQRLENEIDKCQEEHTDRMFELETAQAQASLQLQQKMLEALTKFAGKI